LRYEQRAEHQPQDGQRTRPASPCGRTADAALRRACCRSQNRMLSDRLVATRSARESRRLSRRSRGRGFGQVAVERRAADALGPRRRSDRRAGLYKLRSGPQEDDGRAGAPEGLPLPAGSVQTGVNALDESLALEAAHPRHHGHEQLARRGGLDPTVSQHQRRLVCRRHRAARVVHARGSTEVSGFSRERGARSSPGYVTRTNYGGMPVQDCSPSASAMAARR